MLCVCSKKERHTSCCREEKALREELLAIKAEITKHVTAEKACLHNWAYPSLALWIRNRQTATQLTQEAPASTEEITPDNVNRHVAQAREFVKGMMKVRASQ